MLPTIRESGDVVIVDHFSYAVMNKMYTKGDVVVCIPPYDNTKFVCKRIVAVAGEKVKVSNKQYNNPFEEDYLIIPKGHIWLEGDNSENSFDSKQYGPVPSALVQGKVLCKFQFNLKEPIVLIPNQMISKH